MQKSINIQTINPYLLCSLCDGYLIDATTLVECLHSFCKSCLMKHLDRSYSCPKCGLEIHKSRPLEYIRSDPCLQEIVYKLIPGLFTNEEKRKESWKKRDAVEGDPDKSDKKDNPEKTDKSEKSDTSEKPTLADDDPRILVTLKYFRGTSRMERIKTEKVLQMFPTRYLCCNPDMPVRVLKKFVCLKFDVSTELFNVELWRGDETLCDELTLKQLVQIYGLWRERKPLDLHFSLYPKFEIKPKKVVEERKPIPKFDPNRQKNNISDNSSDTKTNGEQLSTTTIPKTTASTDTKTASDEKPPKTEKENGVTPTDEKPAAVSKNEKSSAGSSKKSADGADSTSKIDMSQLLKDQLNALTRSSSNTNLLNTTDSDSSQRSNVSLDTNAVIDTDIHLASETLENDFLKLFADSQPSSDAEPSSFDPNISIDSDIEKMSRDLDAGILNLFDSEESQDEGKAVPVIPKSKPKTVPKNPAVCTNETKPIAKTIAEIDMVDSTQNESTSNPNITGDSLVADENKDLTSPRPFSPELSAAALVIEKTKKLEIAPKLVSTPKKEIPPDTKVHEDSLNRMDSSNNDSTSSSTPIVDASKNQDVSVSTCASLLNDNNNNRLASSSLVTSVPTVSEHTNTYQVNFPADNVCIKEVPVPNNVRNIDCPNSEFNSSVDANTSSMEDDIKNISASLKNDLLNFMALENDTQSTNTENASISTDQIHASKPTHNGSMHLNEKLIKATQSENMPGCATLPLPLSHRPSLLQGPILQGAPMMQGSLVMQGSPIMPALSMIPQQTILQGPTTFQNPAVIHGPSLIQHGQSSLQQGRPTVLPRTFILQNPTVLQDPSKLQGPPIMQNASVPLQGPLPLANGNFYPPPRRNTPVNNSTMGGLVATNNMAPVAVEPSLLSVNNSSVTADILVEDIVATLDNMVQSHHSNDVTAIPMDES